MHKIVYRYMRFYRMLRKLVLRDLFLMVVFSELNLAMASRSLEKRMI